MTTLHALERPFSCENLAEAIRLAAKRHEDSWLKLSEIYSIPLEEAARQAIFELDLPMPLAHMVYLSLSEFWGDALQWADDIHTTIHGPKETAIS